MNNANIIRIAIVDDDQFISVSLATILSAEADIDVAAVGANGEEAVALYDEVKPDVLLMDIRMPEIDGLSAARRILATHPQARIVFLTTFSDDEYVVAALRMGAKGYLIKQEVANIAPAIRSVMSGQSVLAGEVVGKVDVLVGQSGDSAQFGDDQLTAHSALMQVGLTEREAEIVEAIAQGLDNREIAAKVYIGEGTVRNHVSAILTKLDLKNRTQIAVYYYRSLGT